MRACAVWLCLCCPSPVWCLQAVSCEMHTSRLTAGARPLSSQDGDYQKSKKVEDIYPDFPMMAQSFGVPARRVIHPDDLRPAIR